MTHKKWFQILNKEDTPTTADLLVYDEIGGWFGVEASELVRDILALDVETINLYVNSPGGDVFDAIAIANALRRHKARVVATVDGIAASAASFLIQAADEITMGKGSEMMIHDASAGVRGNAADMQEMAVLLDQVSNTIAELYADRAGEDAEFWRAAMRAETWYTASEAVDAGLADSIVGATTGAAKNLAPVFDMHMYQHPGRRNAPAPAMPTNPEPIAAHATPETVLDRLVALAGIDRDNPVAVNHPVTPVPPVHDTTGRTDDMSDAFVQGVRQRLGVPSDADLDENGVLAALDEVLAESTEAPKAPSAAPPGTVLMDEAEHAELVANATAGRTALAEKAQAERTSLVSAAIGDGRIPVARREHWVKQLEADPGAAEVLAKLAKGTIPVDTVGYTGGIDESPDDEAAGEALYSKLYPHAKEA